MKSYRATSPSNFSLWVVDADWNTTDTALPSYIKNKPEPMSEEFIRGLFA